MGFEPKKRVKTQQQQQNKKVKHKNPWRSRELNPGKLVPKADALPLHQLSVTILVKLFNCFDEMGRNVNKQSRTCGSHIFKNDFCTWITIFGSFSYLRE